MSADPIDLDDLIERCEELSEADFDGGCCNASYPINGVSRALREAAAEIGRLRGEVESLGMQLSDERMITSQATIAPAEAKGDGNG